MDIKEIINRNYQATVRRGLITPETSKQKFIDKMKEEVNELESEVDLPFFNDETCQNLELADIILVCLAYAKHFNIDILKVMEEKTLFNEKR